MSFAPFALALLAAAPAVAEPEEDAVRFRYEAPSTCPSAEVFRARVRERTARGREAAEGELARTFSISISESPRGFGGQIEFLDDTGAPVHRRLQGDECDGVVSSLALITALALDATLRESPAPVAAAKEPIERRTTPEPLAAPAPNAPRAPGGARTPSEPAPRPPAPLLHNVRIGALAAYHSLLPAPTFGLLAQLDFRGDVSLRLRGNVEQAKLEVDPGRVVAVRLLRLSASACAIRPHWGSVALYPCLLVDVGSLRARAIDSAAFRSTSSGTEPWLALGPELRLAWEPRSLPWLELFGRAPLALYRHRFELKNPDKTALAIEHELSFEAGMTAGVRFW